MCGIFGAVATGSKGLSIGVLKAIAKDQEQRGPHAFGVAWVDEGGRLHHFKSQGRISEALILFNRMRGARAVIGHTRFATHGDLTNVNNHPHPVDGGWLVHNGQIPNMDELIDRHSLLPVSDCDSEILGLMIQSRENGSLVERTAFAVNEVCKTVPLNLAAIWARPARVVVVRRGNPLSIGIGKSGNVYFGSIPDSLPGKPGAMKNNVARIYDLGRQHVSEVRVRKSATAAKTKILGSNWFGDGGGTTSATSSKGKKPKRKKPKGSTPRYGRPEWDIDWEELSAEDEILDMLTAEDIEKYLGEIEEE